MPDIAKFAVSAVLPFVTLLVSCSSLTIERVQNGGSGVTQNGGFHYSLEKPVILASVQRSIAYDGTNIVSGIDQGRRTDTTTFSYALIKDPQQTYAIYLNPGWFTSDTQDITYNGRGGFNAFNFTSTDQTATVVATIGKIASTAALAAVAAGVEDLPQPPGSGQIETAVQKGHQKMLSDLLALSLKTGSMSKEDLALFDSLFKEAQSLKPLLYPSTTQTVQLIDVPIVFVDSPDMSIDSLVASKPADYRCKSKFGLIGIARRLQ
jgi:hypothetical protein